jgi:hypothetical protein
VRRPNEGANEGKTPATNATHHYLRPLDILADGDKYAFRLAGRYSRHIVERNCPLKRGFMIGAVFLTDEMRERMKHFLAPVRF